MIRWCHKKLASSFNLCFRKVDHLIVFNKKKFSQSDNLASYLDLTFTFEKDGKFYTKLYDKCDDFDKTQNNNRLY